jgi:hypothetical protein
MKSEKSPRPIQANALLSALTGTNLDLHLLEKPGPYIVMTFAQYPIVTCPGCNEPMTPDKPKPLPSAPDLSDVTYTCEKCGATTERTIKIENEQI